MKSFKPQAETLPESKMQKTRKTAAYAEALAEAQATGVPVRVKGVGTSDTPRLSADSDDAVVRQLQNIWEKLLTIEKLLSTRATVKATKVTEREVVDVTHPAPTPQVKTHNGHPVLPNGMTAKWVEVPTVEQVIAAAKKYKAAHGQEALAQALANFGAAKISELTDENKALFLERVSEEKPEGLED